MKNGLFALLVALALGATFIGYASVSLAGGSTVNGSYVDSQSDSKTP